MKGYRLPGSLDYRWGVSGSKDFRRVLEGFDKDGKDSIGALLNFLKDSLLLG